MNIISKQTLRIIIVVSVLMIGIAEANVVAPTSWGKGWKLWNDNGSYWDLMGEAGIQNGSLVNISWVNTTYAKINGTIQYGQQGNTDLIGSNSDFVSSGSTYFNISLSPVVPCFFNGTHWVNYNFTSGADRRGGC